MAFVCELARFSASHSVKNRSHFGALKELNEGDGVFFTDMDGNRFSYRVKETEILPPGAVEEMTTGDWELTLFTCTFGGASRVTVRCSRIAE